MYRLDGTTLRIDTSCGSDCSVSYEITAPVGVAVHGELRSGEVALDGVGPTDVQVSSGDLVINNATGPVRARATSGDVTVTNAKAAVTAQATSGNVRATDVAGAVDVSASSGDVEVKLTTANSVTARASSGDVTVIVPSGGYRILTGTDSDDVAVNGLTNDASSKYVLDVEASSGDVTVTAAA